MGLTEKRVIETPGKLLDFCERLKTDFQKKVVLTTGAFDILHEGHILYLEKAKDMGDVLIVGVNTDDFVKKLKGEDRPHFNQNHRAFMVASVRYVDFVYIFEDRLQIVELVKPHIFVMSETSHAKPETRMEQQNLVRKHGGEVRILGRMSNIHSSDIIEKLSVPTP